MADIMRHARRSLDQRHREKAVRSLAPPPHTADCRSHEPRRLSAVTPDEEDSKPLHRPLGERMNGFPIQPGKVQAPPLRDETLARDRLLDWLAVKIHQPRGPR